MNTKVENILMSMLKFFGIPERKVVYPYMSPEDEEIYWAKSDWWNEAGPIENWTMSTPPREPKNGRSTMDSPGIQAGNEVRSLKGVSVGLPARQK